MGKDIILENITRERKPRQSCSRPPTYDYSICANEQNYITICPGELLRTGDEYCSQDGIWHVSNLDGKLAGSLYKYRRRVKNESKSINLITHAHLIPSTILEEGDEYYYEYSGGKGFWEKTGRVGTSVGTGQVYRRKLTTTQSSSSDNELEYFRVFKKSEIDLKNYRVVNMNEKLQRGDIYFDKVRNTYETSFFVGEYPQYKGFYYRKKTG